MQLSNYLFFTTTCEAALMFYEDCGLGRIVELRHDDKGRVMHARFAGPGVLFYASDNDDAEPMRGSAHILAMESRAQTERLFLQLATGGRITTKLGMQPWGAIRRPVDAELCRRFRVSDPELEDISIGKLML